LVWLVPVVVPCLTSARARLRRPRSELHLDEPSSRCMILEKIYEYLK